RECIHPAALSIQRQLSAVLTNRRRVAQQLAQTMERLREGAMCRIAVVVRPQCLQQLLFMDVACAESDQRLQQCQRLAWGFAIEGQLRSVEPNFESAQGVDFDRPRPVFGMTCWWRQREFAHQRTYNCRGDPFMQSNGK